MTTRMDEAWVDEFSQKLVEIVDRALLEHSNKLSSHYWERFEPRLREVSERLKDVQTQLDERQHELDRVKSELATCRSDLVGSKVELVLLQDRLKAARR